MIFLILDPKNGMFFFPDEKLARVFPGFDKMSGFRLNKELSPLLSKFEMVTPATGNEATPVGKVKETPNHEGGVGSGCSIDDSGFKVNI